MKIKKVRNQMWVFEGNKPVRQARESEVKRWATNRIIQSLEAEAKPVKSPKDQLNTGSLNLKSV